MSSYGEKEEGGIISDRGAVPMLNWNRRSPSYDSIRRNYFVANSRLMIATVQHNHQTKIRPTDEVNRALQSYSSGSRSVANLATMLGLVHFAYGCISLANLFTQ